MRCRALTCAVLLLCGPVFPRDRKADTQLPTQFEIGRQTFFDFGPPFNYYELLLVRPAVGGSSIDRTILTPAADVCTQPAQIETKSVLTNKSIATLLGTTNPCAISEKELRRELKRCKKCLVFSGVIVRMRVQCGTQARIIRSDILDKDMFDPAPNTPIHTSWTIQLLTRIDDAVGPGVMEKPVFSIPDQRRPPQKGQNSAVLDEVRAGKYDELFAGASDKPSDLYVAAQSRPPAPTVRLLSSSPLQPEVFVQPSYPPIARTAKIKGLVTFMITIDQDGNATNFALENGHPMFRGAVEKAVSEWKFSKEAANQKIRASIEFALNCPAKQP